MKRLIFAAWAAFLGAIAALTWVAVSSKPPAPADSAPASAYTLDEVAAHTTETDCWMAIDGGVYELTDYVARHPTPIDVHCGTDASEGMRTKGVGRSHSAFAWQQLAGYRIGSLVDAAGPEQSAGPRAAYTGSDSCMGCHRDIHQAYAQTLHPGMLGPAADIDPRLLEQWDRIPDPLGNPVVFDENEADGIAGTRDVVLADGSALQGIASVYVDHERAEGIFRARFLDTSGETRHEQRVSLYHVGARYRQALAVNIGDGAGTRLLKYQYSFDDGRYRFEWNDRNQARIYEENCIGCHTSGFDLDAFEADRNRPLEAVTADLGVGCESCHGPGGEHVARPSAPGGIVNLSALSRHQQVHVCAQCHIRGASTVHEGRQDNIDFKPGDNILDRFEPVAVEWGRGWRRIAADGKAAASRQQFMDHFLGTKANLVCTDCHTMHDGDAHGALLRADLLETCAGCHGEAAYPDLDSVRAAMDGLRGWDDGWRGWRSQHTFRLDDQGRVIGLPRDDWPDEGGWPWERPSWQWDFPK